MRQAPAPTLSDHLLREAQKFIFYPERVRSTRRNLDQQTRIDSALRLVSDWRKTFAPRPGDEICAKYLASSESLNELFCRDLLKNVPLMVERILKLKHMSLSGLTSSQFVYLREAANCYVYGLFHSAVALARAALEECLDDKLAASVGKKAVAELDLKDVIEDLARVKALSRDGRARAHKVRVAGNEVLHDEVARAPEALSVIEDARAVILEASRR